MPVQGNIFGHGYRYLGLTDSGTVGEKPIGFRQSWAKYMMPERNKRLKCKSLPGKKICMSMKSTDNARPEYLSKSESLTLFAGTYVRDDSVSDMIGYDEVLHLLKLDKLQRLTAVKLIEGLRIEVSGNQVALRWLTVVPFFQVTERYKLNGMTSFVRRDLKPGFQRAQADIDSEGRLHLSSSWGAPNAGSMHETLSLDEKDRSIILLTELEIEKTGKKQSCMVKYRRTANWKPRTSWNPLEAAKVLAGGEPKIR